MDRDSKTERLRFDAYAKDIKAARLALEGIENGHFHQLEPWEMVFFVIAIDHCEGPDHLQRMRALDPHVEEIIANLPQHLSGNGSRPRAQHARVSEVVVATFGRHPHRNSVLSRPPRHAEERYIAEGDFPHLPKRQ